MLAMMDYYDALARLERELTPIDGRETLPLAACGGRVLAEPLDARFDTPAFDNSAMDGYALADPEECLTRFTLKGRTAAGEAPAALLAPGEACRVFTGAPVPPGTTAVAAQERTRLDGDTVRIEAALAAGLNVRFRAEEYAAGHGILGSGARLGPAALALAASQGYAWLSVRRRLKVTVFSSGNELFEPGVALVPGKIYDANRYQLLAWLATLPVDVVDGGILPDNAGETRKRLEIASGTSDVILTSGGASVGEEDHLKSAISALGSLDAWKLAIKPGKPFAWGRIGAARVFMLPGNPVATFVTFFLLVAPALRALMGVRPMAPLSVQVRAGFERDAIEPRREFLRAELVRSPVGETEVVPLPGQGSAMLLSCARAAVLVEVPPSAAVKRGDWLRVLPLP
jgi:molybdopterin molybdotransferase